MGLGRQWVSIPGAVARAAPLSRFHDLEYFGGPSPYPLQVEAELNRPPGTLTPRKALLDALPSGGSTLQYLHFVLWDGAVVLTGSLKMERDQSFFPTGPVCPVSLGSYCLSLLGMSCPLSSADSTGELFCLLNLSFWKKPPRTLLSPS